MKVEIMLFAHFMKYLPPKSDQDSFSLEVDTSARVGDALRKLAIPPDHPKIIQVNGVRATEDDPLKEGDILRIFPPLPGG